MLAIDTLETVCAVPATVTVKALAAGVEPVSSASFQVSTSVAPFTVAGSVAASVGAVVSAAASVVPSPESDQALSPAALAARTCTW